MLFSRRELLAGAAGSSAFLSAPIGSRADAGRPVRIIENVFIPMPDGAHLAARIVLPADAAERPVGGILDYIPYRKRDWLRTRDTFWGKQLARRGFASVRVDIRGSGDSDGIMLDEYLAPEQRDALSVIAWIAKQPWCNGAVGMRGGSWGAFSALHAAASAPP
jgi:hypothetical protein